MALYCEYYFYVQYSNLRLGPTNHEKFELELMTCVLHAMSNKSIRNICYLLIS